jgi:hypothetical protein
MQHCVSGTNVLVALQIQSWAWWHGRLRQEDPGTKAILGNIWRPCFKNPKPKLKPKMNLLNPQNSPIRQILLAYLFSYEEMSQLLICPRLISK